MYLIPGQVFRTLYPLPLAALVPTSHNTCRRGRRLQETQRGEVDPFESGAVKDFIFFHTLDVDVIVRYHHRISYAAAYQCTTRLLYLPL